VNKKGRTGWWKLSQNNKEKNKINNQGKVIYDKIIL